MTRVFKRKCTIDRATLFKAEYIYPFDDLHVEVREFKSVKSLNQWIDRQNAEYIVVVVNRYALIDDVWEPYTTIGKKTLTLNELECIVRDLKYESLKSSKSKNEE